MKPAPFEQTPEFKSFSEAMRKLVSVPKAELDEQVRLHEKESAEKRKAPKSAKQPD